MALCPSLLHAAELSLFTCRAPHTMVVALGFTQPAVFPNHGCLTMELTCFAMGE